MFEPVRGGTRGGQAEFKWSDVSQDKDRENYLGHSINAPTGRWQKNKDIHWYQRDLQQDEDARREEIRRIQEAEAEALAAALGFAAGAKPGASAGVGTGANAIAVPTKALSIDGSLDPDKEERRRLKALKKEEKRAKKEEKRAKRRRERGDASSDEDDRWRHHHRSRTRSRSPRRRDHDRSRSPRRIHSRSPRRRDRSADRIKGEDRRYSTIRDRSRSPLPRRKADLGGYGEEARRREREMDRQRWDDNAGRNRPSGIRWGRD